MHDGYFSIDKKGTWTDTAENNQGNRDNAERAYNLIMKDKEKLLSFETPLKFIFSHSALREGWDNPNVFQICALREMGTERERRQTIGRGLRLCVNQRATRLRGFDVNTLTVIATESYEQFADGLQKEIEAPDGDPLRHRRQAGGQERRRKATDRQDATGGAQWRRIERPVGPDQTQFHTLRSFRQRDAHSSVRPGDQLRPQSRPRAALAQGRPGDWQGRHSTPGNVELRPDRSRGERYRAARPVDQPPGENPAHPPEPARILIDSQRLDDFKRNPQQFIDLAARAILNQLIDLRVGMASAIDEPCESLLVR